MIVFCFQVRLKRKIHFVEQMLNHLRQMREQKRILFLHNGAELYIAKAVRAFHMRKKLNKLIYWNRFVRAVTCIGDTVLGCGVPSWVSRRGSAPNWRTSRQ